MQSSSEAAPRHGVSCIPSPLYRPACILPALPAPLPTCMLPCPSQAPLPTCMRAISSLLASASASLKARDTSSSRRRRLASRFSAFLPTCHRNRDVV